MSQQTKEDARRGVMSANNGDAKDSNEGMRYFVSRLIDDAPHLLEQSYNLRYQVYCLERGFLQPENYPDKLESDEFDRYAFHFGALNTNNELVGTVRLVRPSTSGLPLIRHCTIFTHEQELLEPTNKVMEISRLSVSRNYRKRLGDGFYGLQEEASGASNKVDRRGREHMVFSLYKAIYQMSKRLSLTHWVVATESSLQRLLVKYGFPFRPIGPEVDYFGPVAPYVMHVLELDQVILTHRIPMLDEFLVGLESEFKPQLTKAAFLSGSNESNWHPGDRKSDKDLPFNQGHL